MIQVYEIVNSLFTSKTYILYKEGYEKVRLVVIGDIDPVADFLKKKGKIIEGVFITHGHFDHIYGLNDLIGYFPNCKIYAHPFAKETLASDKLNMSKYHGTPFVYQGNDVIAVSEGDVVSLFNNEPPLSFYETPGHNAGCLTMVLDNKIFTGDSYIPGVRVYTHIPHSNKQLAKQSLDRIIKMSEGKMFFSGHYIGTNNE